MNTFIELKEKLKTGEDVSAYVDIDLDHRIVLAKQGLHVEEIIVYNEPRVIKTLIRKGYAENHYDEWKNHKNKYIRATLANRKYFPEHFIKDKEPEVRIAVVKNFPEYLPEIIGRSKHEDIAAAAIFVTQENPNMDLLHKFLETNPTMNIEQRIALAKYPSCIQALLKSDDEDLIRHLIWQGQEQERYEEWKHHYRPGVRLALATNGYDPDYFIHDNNQDVKFEAFKHKPSLLPNILNNGEHMNNKLVKYFSRVKIFEDLDLVKQFLDSNPNIHHPVKLEALKLKYQMQTTETSLIEKTMSLRQQVENNYYAFAKEWSANRIFELLNAREQLERKQFLDNLDKLVAASTNIMKLRSLVQDIVWGR